MLLRVNTKQDTEFTTIWKFRALFSYNDERKGYEFDLLI